MGLAERRATKEFRDNRYPSLEASVHSAAGFDVPIEIDWDSLASDDYAHLYDECWPKVYFTPLIAALQSITGDDLGREALAASLARIVIRNTGGNSSPRSAIIFDSKVLTIDHDPVSNIDDVKDRTEYLTGLLEKAL